MFLDSPHGHNSPGLPGPHPGAPGRLVIPSHYAGGKPDIGRVSRPPTPQEQEAMREIQAQIMSVAMAIIARFGGVELAPPGTGIMMEGLKRLEAWIRTQTCCSCLANLGDVFNGLAEACPACSVPKNCLVQAATAALEPHEGDPETQDTNPPEIGPCKSSPAEEQPPQ